MRYDLLCIQPGTLRSFERFAWLPRRLARCIVWLECYTVTQRYIDPDGDGVFDWVTIAEDPNV